MSTLPPLRREGPTTILPNRNAAAPSMTSIRRRFLTRGFLEDDLVPAPILRSWQRCAALGLRMDMRPTVEPIGRADLRERHDRAERLRLAASGEMRLLRDAAVGAGAIVVLTDDDGVVLDRLGDDGFAEKAARVALRPGVAWREDATGTNAIGTALAERREITVFGAEHFFENNRFLSCTAAPVIDPRGATAGVLDLTGPADVRSPHAAALLWRAVGAIEKRLFADAFADREVVQIHDDPDEIDGPGEGLLAFEGDRLVGATRAGLAFIGRDWDALTAVSWSGLFDGGRPRGGALDRLISTDGRTLWARRRGTPVAPRRVPPRVETPRPLLPTVPGEPSPPLPVKVEAETPPSVRPDATIVWGEGRSRALIRATRLLDAEVPVLIQGETGTGKEVFARALHAASTRRDRRFVAVNCAALPESLIEAELFGYEEGAFTGARKKGSKGLLREADGGVLFLDEIGDMPIGLQARLLRALQEREVMPLGGGRAIPVDFALVCASHRDLPEAVERKEFRQDLYFRVAQYTVALDPLRGRADLDEIIATSWARMGGEARGVRLAPETLAALVAHEWPGNWRQLTAALRTLLVLAEPGETLAVDALSVDIRRGAAPPTGGPTAPTTTKGDKAAEPCRLEDLRRATMAAALEACGGNVTRAAARLGVHRSTLYRRLVSGQG
jgi:transcriptional regulator of acetoin/glycerol metabolism